MERIRDSFDRQGFMRTLGAVLESVEPGTVTITCGFDETLTQQHGLFHGGVVASLVDVACGYAALSVMPADREVLTVEFKVHFLKPAKTDRVIAVGQVVQAGRTLTVCEGSVFDATRTRILARMTGTMMAVAATIVTCGRVDQPENQILIGIVIHLPIKERACLSGLVPGAETS
jgi:uncharacterized protein (TIGR00369 family)